MNAIVEKIKNRSYYPETAIAAEETSALEKEKSTLVLIKKKQQKTGFERLIDTEIELMLHHCRRKEGKIVTSDGLLTDTPKLSHKIARHERLQKELFPATLKSIKYANSYLGESSARINFLKIPAARYFFSIAIMALIFTLVGYGANETSLFTGYYSFELTDTAVLFFNQSYGIAAVFLGSIVYLTSKLLKQVHNVTLTASRIPFYWSSLFLSLSASIFLSESIQFFLIDSLLVNMIIGVIIGFVADFINTIFRK